MLPNFLVIGAARSGTTSLYHHLAEHPDVFMSPIKEPRYFAVAEAPPIRTGMPGEDRVWSDTIDSRAAYEALSANVRHEKAVGEASVLYLWSRHAPARIRREIPDAKLVVSLRDPVERAFSHFLHNRSLGYEPHASFEEALEADARDHRSAYLEQGLYFALLSRYCERFPRTQILVQTHDDLVSDPLAYMRRIFRFLDVDDAFEPSVDRIHNASASGDATPPRPDPATRARLVPRYRDEVQRLEALLERDLEHWLW